MATDIDQMECYDMCELDDPDLTDIIHRMDTCYDDTTGATGEWLDPPLVHEGCMEEMRPFREMQVHERVPRQEALSDPEMMLFGVRWVNVNKGTRDAPKVRRRLVAQEFATTKNDDLFAGTPPLLALRMLLSDVASVQLGAKVVLAMDVKCAFLYRASSANLQVNYQCNTTFTMQGDVGVLRRSKYGPRWSGRRGLRST